MSKRTAEIESCTDAEIRLDEIQAAGAKLREAIEAEENYKAGLKAAREARVAAEDRLKLLTGAKEESRPLLDQEGEEEAEE